MDNTQYKTYHSPSNIRKNIYKEDKNQVMILSRSAVQIYH